MGKKSKSRGGAASAQKGAASTARSAAPAARPLEQSTASSSNAPAPAKDPIPTLLSILTSPEATSDRSAGAHPIAGFITEQLSPRRSQSGSAGSRPPSMDAPAPAFRQPDFVPDSPMDMAGDGGALGYMAPAPTLGDGVASDAAAAAAGAFRSYYDNPVATDPSPPPTFRERYDNPMAALESMDQEEPLEAGAALQQAFDAAAEGFAFPPTQLVEEESSQAAPEGSEAPMAPAALQMPPPSGTYASGAWAGLNNGDIVMFCVGGQPYAVTELAEAMDNVGGNGAVRFALECSKGNEPVEACHLEVHFQDGFFGFRCAIACLRLRWLHQMCCKMCHEACLSFGSSCKDKGSANGMLQCI